jgi:hypothetical protein
MAKQRISEQKDRFTYPEWRLYANFLYRELGRLWHGKKSIFALVRGDEENAEFWRVFGIIFTATIQKFGAAHDHTFTVNEVARRAECAYEEYNKLTGLGFPFGTPIHQVYWIVRRILGNKLASEFLYDLQIIEIVALAVCACGYAAEGKMPPYIAKGLRPIEFFEGLRVAPALEEQFYGPSSSSKN